MRILLLITIYLSAIKTIVAQEVSKNYQSNWDIYAAVIDTNYKMIGENFPEQLFINGDMLSYVKEFLDDKSLAPSLKKYILENGWDFLKDVDTVGRLKVSVKIGFNDLKPFLSKEMQIDSGNVDLYYSVSPVIFSKNRKKAFLVFLKGSRTDVLEVITYFFERKKNRWKLVKVMIPYYI